MGARSGDMTCMHSRGTAMTRAGGPHGPRPGSGGPAGHGAGTPAEGAWGGADARLRHGELRPAPAGRLAPKGVAHRSADLRGLDRDWADGWSNPFSVIVSSPADRPEKVSMTPDRAMPIPASLSHRECYGQNASSE